MYRYRYLNISFEIIFTDIYIYYLIQTDPQIFPLVILTVVSQVVGSIPKWEKNLRAPQIVL